MVAALSLVHKRPNVKLELAELENVVGFAISSAGTSEVVTKAKLVCNARY